jgi:uncharacterized DUF497 family protein
VRIEFEWDAGKARENRRKHGVSFDQAKQAFTDPFGVEWIDESGHDEERTILLAMADGAILVVVFTERGDRLRLISARKANRNEKSLYFKESAR